MILRLDAKGLQTVNCSATDLTVENGTVRIYVGPNETIAFTSSEDCQLKDPEKVFDNLGDGQLKKHKAKLLHVAANTSGKHTIKLSGPKKDLPQDVPITVGA